jgi:hypothetical protein
MVTSAVDRSVSRMQVKSNMQRMRVLHLLATPHSRAQHVP